MNRKARSADDVAVVEGRVGLFVAAITPKPIVRVIGELTDQPNGAVDGWYFIAFMMGRDEHEGMSAPIYAAGPFRTEEEGREAGIRWRADMERAAAVAGLPLVACEGRDRAPTPEEAVALLNAKEEADRANAEVDQASEEQLSQASALTMAAINKARTLH